MLARSASYSLASCVLLASFAALGGCQMFSKSSKSSSSFSVSTAPVTEANFAQCHQFYYYPSKQVYRDCDEDRWLWSEDGGASFQASRALPVWISVGDEIPFAVFLTLDAPATEHQRIAAAYPVETGTTVSVQGSNELPY